MTLFDNNNYRKHILSKLFRASPSWRAPPQKTDNCNQFVQSITFLVNHRHSQTRWRRYWNTHTTDLPALEYGTPVSTSQWHLYRRVVECFARTSVLHDAVSIPKVMRLHLLSDLTPTTWTTESTLWLVKLLRTRSLPMYAPIVVTTRQLVLDPISIPKFCFKFCNYALTWTKFCCSNFSPKFHDNRSSCSGSNFRAKCYCSNLCGHPSTRSEPNSQFYLWPFITSFWTQVSVLSFQSSHKFLSVMLFTLLSLINDWNSHIVKPPQHWNVSSMRWIGLILSRLHRWQLSCCLFPCMISPQICAPIVRPPVCNNPSANVIPTRVGPLCIFLKVLCFLFVFVLLHFVKPFLLFWPCSLPFLILAFCFSWCSWFVFDLAFVLFASVLDKIAFASYRPCQIIHSFDCFSGIRFSFDSLSPRSTPWTISLECLILTAHRRQSHRYKLCVSSCWFKRFQYLFTYVVHSIVPAVLMSKWSRKPPFLKLLVTTPMLIISDNVSFASCIQDVTRLSKSVKETMRLAQRGCQQIRKFRNCRDSWNWCISSEEKIRFQSFRFCQPLCSSSRQHDQHVTQLLCGNVALNDVSAKHKMVAESLRCSSTCS